MTKSATVSWRYSGQVLAKKVICSLGFVMVTYRPSFVASGFCWLSYFSYDWRIPFGRATSKTCTSKQ